MASGTGYLPQRGPLPGRVDQRVRPRDCQSDRAPRPDPAVQPKNKRLSGPAVRAAGFCAGPGLRVSLRPPGPPGQRAGAQCCHQSSPAGPELCQAQGAVPPLRDTGPSPAALLV